MFRPLPRHALAAVMLSLFAASLHAADELRGERFLDNGVIRLGVDLDRGGVISYLSLSGRDENVVNNYDLGRQIQMSFYSGPIPFTVGEKKPQPHWAHIGWNPIQTGDDYRHGSKILDFKLDPAKHELYVRCIPMQWPLDNEPAECEFESWLRLEGATVEARARMVNRRGDKTQYAARYQELPAVYVNGPYYRHFTYSGSRPFTGGELTLFDTTEGRGFPWKHTTATENWCALVNDDDFGLGVYHPGCYEFSGGFAGKTGSGGTKDAPTGYIAPVQIEVIDHNIDYEYRYTLILGKLSAIRDYVVAQHRKSAQAAKPRVPDYRFLRDRQHWRFANCRDSGWPIRGELNVTCDAPDPHLTGPRDFWLAEDAPKIYVTAAYSNGAAHKARLYWHRFGEAGFAEKNLIDFEVSGDDQFRTYEVDLAKHANYRGPIIGLRFDPVEGDSGSANSVRIKSIRGYAR